MRTADFFFINLFCGYEVMSLGHFYNRVVTEDQNQHVGAIKLDQQWTRYTIVNLVSVFVSRNRVFN